MNATINGVACREARERPRTACPVAAAHSRPSCSTGERLRRSVCRSNPAQGEWQISHHALQCMRDRGFSRADVLATCHNPSLTYTSFDHGEGQYVFKRGHVSLVVHPESKTVITVLLRSHDTWDDEDARRANRMARAAEDRS